MTGGRWAAGLALLALLLVLLGIKLRLIAVYGNATPLWDQWEAEAGSLYRPHVEGTLRWSDLLAPHNEHRIFTHRVLALALFALNGTWNPLLQMLVNAAVHVLTIGLAVVLLARVVGREQLPALVAFSLVLFAVPYGWENTLGGFHGQFYLVLPFSLAGLWFLTTSAPLSARWWAGAPCAVLAFLSLASGLLVPAVAALVGFALWASGRRRTGRQLFSVVLLAGLFIVEAALTPRLSLSYASEFKAATVSQFFDAWTAGLGWPLASSSLAALARNLPALVFAGAMLAKRPAADDRRWFLLALVAWFLGQSIGIAYGRALGNLSSRYLDSFALGILVNFACWIALATEQVGRRRNATLLAAGAWVIALVISLGLYAEKHLPAELEERHALQLAQELNTREYLATDDLALLKSKPPSHVPHFSPKRLSVLLASPTVRALLPANLRPALTPASVASEPADAFVAHGYYSATPERAGWTLGSFGPRGDAATGVAEVRFDANPRGAVLAIPVAGYPSNADLRLELEQGGRRRALTVRDDPLGGWRMVEVAIGAGPFSIVLTDGNQGSTGWLAIGAPEVRGKWDAFTERVLANAFVLVFLGLAAGILSVGRYGLATMRAAEASATPPSA